MADGGPLLVDVPAAARLLGIGTTRAWAMARRGELPGVLHIGRSVRVSVERLEEWIREQSRATLDQSETQGDHDG